MSLSVCHAIWLQYFFVLDPYEKCAWSIMHVCGLLWFDEVFFPSLSLSFSIEKWFCSLPTIVHIFCPNMLKWYEMQTRQIITHSFIYLVSRVNKKNVHRHCHAKISRAWNQSNPIITKLKQYKWMSQFADMCINILNIYIKKIREKRKSNLCV